MSPKVVLVIEDNDDNRIIFSSILAHYGYQTLEAGDGLTGVAMAREYQPHLLLIDINLPSLSGWEVATRLRRDPSTAHIPMIAVTAHTPSESRMMARAAGFDAFLSKPVEPRHLAEEVQRIIGPPPAATPAGEVSGG